MGASDSNLSKTKIEASFSGNKGYVSPLKSKSKHAIIPLYYSEEDSNRDLGPNLAPF